MTHDERRLIRHLFIAVAVKLVVLALLWWAFVRDVHVAADPDQMAAHVGVTTPAPGATQ